MMDVSQNMVRLYVEMTLDYRIRGWIIKLEVGLTNWRLDYSHSRALTRRNITCSRTIEDNIIEWMENATSLNCTWLTPPG